MDPACTISSDCPINGTAINVNQTSLQMRDAVNQRVFDCPAAGGFVITDNQPDLHEYFDVTREMVTYDSLGELSDKVRSICTTTMSVRPLPPVLVSGCWRSAPTPTGFRRWRRT